MAYLELKDLHRDFGAVKALNGIDIALGEGEFLSLLGPSGCGKTTALRLVAGFDRPDAGRDRRRRQGRDERRAEQARHGHGLPGLLALPEHDGAPERRVRPEDPRQAEAGAPRACARTARARRARARRRPLPASALRRHAAARRAGARARDRAARAAARRAALGARREGARAAARGDPAHPAGARDHDALRHARPGGGARDLRPRRGDVRRA